MDVDPVVGEEVLAVEDERDGQEVAVAQAVGGFADLGCGLGLGHPTVAQRQRGDHVRRPKRLAAGPDAHAAVAVDLEFATGAFSRTSPPSWRMSSVIVSHIWPGPKRG